MKGMARAMSRRRISSVLHNFLGTYASRESDYEGYCVFGMLVDQIDRIEIDLLHPKEWGGIETPLSFSMKLAAKRFADQIAKSRVPLTWVREAWLSIVRSPDAIQGQVNDRACSGYDLRFTANAVSDLGKTYERTVSVFVAPHNPTVERRRYFDNQLAGPTPPAR